LKRRQALERRAEIVDDTRARFTLTITDFAEQARSSGFLRGVTVGFLSSFYVFDKGLTDGQITAAVGRLILDHTVEAALSLAVAVGTAIYLTGRLFVEQREQLAKAHHMRARLGLTGLRGAGTTTPQP
jgi:hypothetical protein